MMDTKMKLKPVLDKERWTIGGNPDLGELQGNCRMRENELIRQECVDHTLFKAADGKWHLWGCIRGTKIGRIFYHWKSDSLSKRNWERTGEIIRGEELYGEYICCLDHEECIRSPFVTHDDEKYYMFYSSHKNEATVNERSDNPQAVECIHEIPFCMMESKDGISWSRHLNSRGTTELFSGPGQARDACVIKINNIWHLYYTGHDVFDGMIKPAFFVRTSENLLDWSDPILVHQDLDEEFGSGLYHTECPHVVERDGYYYLFRTRDYASGSSYVFRSDNPYDFGRNGAKDKFVCKIDIAAPEIIVDDDGQEYITSSKDLWGGVSLGKLYWVEE